MECMYVMYVCNVCMYECMYICIVACYESQPEKLASYFRASGDAPKGPQFCRVVGVKIAGCICICICICTVYAL